MLASASASATASVSASTSASASTSPSASTKGRVGETKARLGHYPIMRELLIPCSYLKWLNGFTTIVTFIPSKLSLVLKEVLKIFRWVIFLRKWNYCILSGINMLYRVFQKNENLTI